MSTTRRVLDAFCCAGGAGEGYRRAGFAVDGIDIDHQKRYRAGNFFLGDAIAFIREHGHKYDLIHASPPCQRYTPGAKQAGTSDKHPDLIDPTREACIEAGRPYIIENVEGARHKLLDPLMLCGVSFDLDVFRHRYFESSLDLKAPEHLSHPGKIGDGRFVAPHGHSGGTSTRDGVSRGSTADWRRAMDIDWMTGRELAESIPPAYTEFLGRQAHSLIV